MADIIFIGGSGRCGTHITKDTLSLHSEVCSLPFEYRFIIDPDGLIDFYTSMSACWSPYILDHKLKRLERLFRDLSKASERYVGWELGEHIPGFDSMVAGLISALYQFSYDCQWVGSADQRAWYGKHQESETLAQILSGFIQNVAHAICSRQQARVFVDDNTWNILFAKELFQLVPDAKLIHVYRDPRDVVDSMTHQGWCPDSRLKSAHFYAGIMDRWEQVRVGLPSSKVMEFKLEDLIANKNGVLSALCDFIGIDCQCGMLKSDLRYGNIGRWRKGFTGEDRETVLPILEPYIERMGYK